MTETLVTPTEDEVMDGASPAQLDFLRAQVPAAAKSLTMEYYRHAEIHPDPGQPREKAEAWLRTSIAAEGMLKPLLLRPCPVQPEFRPLADDATDAEKQRRTRDLLACPHCAVPWVEIASKGEYMLIDGESRWRSAAGVMDAVPAIVRYDAEKRGRRLLSQAAANSGKPLTPLEEALLFEEAMADDPSLSHGDIAATLGRPRSSVTDRLALLKNKPWMSLYRQERITVSQLLETSRYAVQADPYVHAQAIEQLEAWATDEDCEIADMELATFKWRLARAYGVEEKPAPVPPPQLDLETRSAPTLESPESADVEDRDDWTEAADEQLSEPANRIPPKDETPSALEPTSKRTAPSDAAGSESRTAPATAPRDRAVAGGFFSKLAQLIGFTHTKNRTDTRVVNIFVASGKDTANIRVTVTGLAAPWQVEASPAEIDAELVDKIAALVAAKPTIDEAAVIATAKETAKASRPDKASGQKPDKKPISKALKDSKPTFPKQKAGKKSAAKKSTQKKPSGRKHPTPTEPPAIEEQPAAPVVDPAQMDIVDDVIVPTEPEASGDPA